MNEFQRNLITNALTERGKLFMVKDSSSLLSLDGLDLSKKTLAYIKQKKISVDQAVLYGRITAYGILWGFEHIQKSKYSRSSAKWRVELASALDKAGYVRNDIDPQFFRFARLYNIVFKLRGTPEYIPISINEVCNKSYQELPEVGLEQSMDFDSALQQCLDPRELTIINLRFGFENGTSHNLEEVGKQLHITRERARQIEAKALRKLTARSYMFPPLFYSAECDERLKQLALQLEDLHKDPVFLREAELKKDLRACLRTPFKCTGYSRYKLRIMNE